MDIINLFKYTFFQNALLGAFCASIVCGIIGTYIVTRRLVFISGGITHASLGGIGAGIYFGLNPILSAMIFSVLSAFGIQWVSRNHKIRQDSAIGVFWSLGMAIGIIFIFLTPGYTTNLTEYLFGSILTITYTDIVLLLICAIFLIIFFAVSYHYIISTSFDSEFAKTKKVKTNLIEYIMMFFVAVSIVLVIRLVGIVLLMSLITIPQITANLFTNKYSRIIFLSSGINFFGSFIGLILSSYIEVPSGPFIIFVLILIFIISKGIKFIYYKKNQLIK